MLGFDTLFQNDFADDEIARISASEQRLLLTRDVGVLKRKEITHGCYVRASGSLGGTASDPLRMG
jgi:uncharacterized protein with PIN domain